MIYITISIYNNSSENQCKLKLCCLEHAQKIKIKYQIKQKEMPALKHFGFICKNLVFEYENFFFAFNRMCEQKKTGGGFSNCLMWLKFRSLCNKHWSGINS